MSDPIIIDNLESYRGKFHEYVSRRDVEGLTSLYTENASLMANIHLPMKDTSRSLIFIQIVSKKE